MAFQTLIYRSRIDTPADQDLEWHASQGAFDRLTPSWADVEVVSTAGTIDPGDSKTIRVGWGPKHFEWTLQHQTLASGLGFSDVQISGPFQEWEHQHRFEPAGSCSHILEDRITYSLPLGIAGNFAANGRVESSLDQLFHFRHARTAGDLRILTSEHPREPMRIAMSGASGMVGRQLAPFLTAGGHEVIKLVRRPAAGQDEIEWDPEGGRLDPASLEGIDAVIHLGGANIGDGRWSGDRKTQILESRINGTNLLATAMAKLPTPPPVLISVSGVGFYGNGGNSVLDETHGNGTGFLADVCREWESAAQPAVEAGVRVVHPRLGVVISGNGGFLARMHRIFRFGLGGKIADGQQYLSWVAMDDLVAGLYRLIADESIEGPVNLTSPNPVTNAEFTATLGKVLGRPAFARVPARAARLALGEMADELVLVSQRAVPDKLIDSGFAFTFPRLEETLRHELGRPDTTELRSWVATHASSG